MAPQVLFQFTHAQLKRYLREEDLIYADGALSEIGGFYFLHLNIRINSKTAKETFGSIEIGSPLRITLLNGRKLYLRNMKSSIGFYDNLRGNTHYEVSYIEQAACLKSD